MSIFTSSSPEGEQFGLLTDTGGVLRGSLAPDGAASGGRIFGNTLFVDSTFSGGGSTGAFERPFSTWQAAINAAGVTPTMIIGAPAVYNEALAIPAGRKLGLCLLENPAGFPHAQITGLVSWTVANGDELHFSGINLPGGVAKVGVGVGGFLGLRDLSAGAIALAGCTVTSSSPQFGIANNAGGAAMALAALACDVAETTNTSHSGDVTATTFWSCTTGALIGNLTHTVGTAFLTNTEVQGTQSIHVNVNLFIDRITNYYLLNQIVKTGGGLVQLLDPSGTLVGQVATGAAVTIDWSAGPVQQLTLNASTTATFLAPLLQQQTLELVVIQNAAGGHTLTFPATCRTPGGGATAAAPAVGANAVSRYTLEWNGTNYDWTAQRDFKL